MKCTHAVTGLGLLMLCVAPPRAQAVDLTGTWTGKIVCDSFDPAGKSKGGVTDDIMLITQTGADLNIVADEFGFLYDGKVIDDPANPAKKGQATFIECRTTPANADTSEMGRTKVVIKADGIAGKFKAQSILSDPDPLLQTCKWTYRRVDTTDPAVPECGAMPPADPAARKGTARHH